MDGSYTDNFVSRWKLALGRVAAIPFVFFGVGLYRAWLATFFRYNAYPTISVLDYFIFEAAIGIVSLALAFSAHKISPLWSNRNIFRLAGTAMLTGSIFIACGCFFSLPVAVKLWGLVCAGGGLAALILMWAEFFGSINPLRVALYHALALFVGEALKWLFMGLSVPYLVFFSLVLPLGCLACIRLSMHHLSRRDLMRSRQGNADLKVIPKKLIALMACCTFAGGFSALPVMPLVLGNVGGAMFVTALVFFGVLSASRWFNFDTVYQLAFPLFILGFLLLMPSLGESVQITALCYDAGYTMLSMYLMIVMSNITYRFGVNAVWINGIERGIRYTVELLGCLAFASAQVNLNFETISILGGVVAAAVLASFVVNFFTERGLSAKWGIDFNQADLDGVSEESKWAMRASDLSQSHNLSPREEEVLQLLAQKASIAEIEEVLYVSQGTVKAHMSHIYRKLGIHSKSELQKLLFNTSSG